MTYKTNMSNTSYKTYTTYKSYLPYMSYKSYLSYLVLFVLLFSFFIAPAKPALSATLSRPPTNLGLVGYWPLDEGTGNKVNDASGQGNIGTITGATWANGKRGKALIFNGSSDKIVIPNSTNLNISGSEITSSVWFKASALSGKTMLLNKGSYGHHWNYGIGLNGANLMFRHHNGDIISTSITVPLNSWNNFTAVYSGGNDYFYFNGLLVDTKSDTGWQEQTGSHQLTLGAAYNINTDLYSEFFNGTIDEVRIYNRALTATEISKLYSSGQVTRKQVANTGLVGYWSLNDGAGTRAVDSSGNLKHSTLSGGTTWVNGKRSKSLNFNGVDSYGDVDLRNSGLTGSQTLSAWVKTSGPPFGKPHQTVLATDPTYQYGIKLMTYKNINRVGLWLGSGSTNYEAFVNTNINDGQWHFVLGVYDYNAGTVTMYIDGVAYSPLSSGQMVINVSDVGKIGRDYHNSDYSYNGIIDDVRIYNRALTATEVQALYKQNETVVNASQNNRLTNGLVGLWSFNGPDYNSASTTAEVLDRSGQSNNGDNTGATVAQGKSGQALSFNGSSSYVFMPNNTANSNMTFSGWIKPTIASGYIATEGIPNSGIRYQLYFSSQKLAWGCYQGPWITVLSDNAISTGVWTHFVAVIDSTISNGMALYINGIKQANTDTITACTPYGGLYLGAYIWPISAYYNGSLDEVRVYNRALSADEVKQLYNLGK